MDIELKDNSVLIRITFIGDRDSGKDQLREDCFGDTLSSIDRTESLGVDFSHIKYDIKDVKIVLQFWAMSILDKHKAVRELYYKKTGAVVLIFDVTKPETFYNLPIWLEEIWKSAGRLPMVILGNNSHLREKKGEKKCVSFKLANLYAKRISEKVGFEVKYYETSNRNCENIDETIKFLAEVLYEKYNLAELGSKK